MYVKAAQQLRMTWDVIKRSLNRRRVRGPDGTPNDIISFEHDVEFEIPMRLIQHVDHNAFPNVELDESVPLHAKDIKKIFDVVLDRILRLISHKADEIRRHPVYSTRPIVLLLTGGLAESAYIQSELQLRFDASMKVVSVPIPSAAVFRGATAFALNPKLFTSMISPCSYGFLGVVPMTPLDPTDQCITVTNGRIMVKVFSPLVVIGQVLEADQWISRDFSFPPSDTAMPIPLYASYNKHARYVSEPSVMKVAMLHFKIPPALNTANRTVHMKMSFGPVIRVRAQVPVPADPSTTARNTTMVDVPVTIEWLPE